MGADDLMGTVDPPKPPGLFLQLAVWFLLIVVAPVATFVREAVNDGDHWEQTVGSTAFLTASIVLLLAAARELFLNLLTPPKSAKWRGGALLTTAALMVVFAYTVDVYAHIASMAEEGDISSSEANEAIFIFVCAVVCGTVGVLSAAPHGSKK